ncbi:cytochrome P450 [Aspergillus coremiiformis]|uniref:Cytochrome P450 n=1 Tax=Aspergillus coremiiformis TaxID=138285 RepID=A0A5N6YY77_9EURO|nr:cytochrome P450 [Aspergillus coremiiformis]
MRQEPSWVESLMEGFLSLFSTHASRIMLHLPTRRMRQVRYASRHIRNFCGEIVKARRAKHDLQLSTESETNIAAVALRSAVFTDDELADQMMTFLAAGHGTTSHALQWAVYALCKHPGIQERLREEIKTHLGSITDSKPTASAADIDNLPYLHAVCSETLRFYPSIPSTIREALHDTTVAGHQIPKGTRFTISPAVTNVDQELWGPDAGVFNPERWIRDRQANSGGVRSHHGVLTFLQGPRSCVGASFARAELACLVAVLVGRFRMKLEDPEREEELTKRGVGAAPADGVRVRLEIVTRPVVNLADR